MDRVVASQGGEAVGEAQRRGRGELAQAPLAAMDPTSLAQVDPWLGFE